LPNEHVNSLAMSMGGRRERLYGQYGLLIPDRYAANSVEALGAFLDNVNRRVLIRIVQNPGQYILRGPTGTGKTSIACVAAREWMRGSGKAIAFVPFTQFCSRLSGLDYGQAESLAVQVATASMLVLDDLGNADKTWNGQLSVESPKRIEIADNIISGRHAARLPMIVTTNLDEKGIETQYGPRIASRLAEFTNLFVGGRDLRVVGAS
jgi:DNA replication protein DnaC